MSEIVTPINDSRDAIYDLLTGKTLNELDDLRSSIAQQLGELRATADTLVNGQSEAVVGALRTILASENYTAKYPRLPSLIARAKPSHMHTPLVIAALQADIPVWLHGEAGSGKSTTGQIAAESLGLGFRGISLGPTTSKSDVLGYRDATGSYHDTGFRRVYEDGGVFLFDEIDNAHPSILTLLNSALANHHGEFPDGRVPRAQSARFIATANTIGRGANAQYVGRTPIDAATLDRFAFVPMDIDERLEESIVLLNAPSKESDVVDISEGEVPTAPEWLAIVRASRQAAGELGIKTIISPRAAIYGARLAELGIGKKWLNEMLIYKGMREQDREKLSRTAGQLVRRLVDTNGDRLVTDGALERPPKPEFEGFPWETINNSRMDLEDYIDRCLRDDSSTEEFAFATSLSWHLDKHFSRTLLLGSNRPLLGIINNIETSKVKKISALIKAINNSSHARSMLNGMPCSTFTGRSDYYSQICGAALKKHGCDDFFSDEFETERGDFRETYGFEPGPYSLAWWLANRPDND